MAAFTNETNEERMHCGLEQFGKAVELLTSPDARDWKQQFIGAIREIVPVVGLPFDLQKRHLDVIQRAYGLNGPAHLRGTAGLNLSLEESIAQMEEAEGRALSEEIIGIASRLEALAARPT